MSKKEDKNLQKNPEKKSENLSIMERKFLVALPTAKNATEAAKAAGYAEPTQAAYKLMRRLDLSDIFDAMGIDDGTLTDLVRQGIHADRVIASKVVIKADDPSVKDKQAEARDMDFVEVPDWPTRHKFIQMAFELRNRFPAKRIEASVGGQEVIERWKQEMGIDEQSLSGIREVDMDGVPSETLSVPETDSEPGTEGVPTGPEEGSGS